MPGAVTLSLPDWTELRSALACWAAGWQSSGGLCLLPAEAVEITDCMMIWLEHSGLPLSDLCDGTATVTVPGCGA